MTTAQVGKVRPFRPSLPLVEAKLHPPVLRPGTVDRPRLVALLSDASAPPIISAIAPPGYGKTTLFALWAGRVRQPVAWLTLDPLDNDPATLISYLAAALDRIQPLDAATRRSISGPGTRVLATAVPRLAAALHGWGQPGAVVFDDVHHLVDRTCLDVVTALLDHLPPRFHMALVGRTEPDLHLARFRAQRDLLEIGANFLALDDAETVELMANVGYAPSPDEARTIAERTEGWAVGTYLTALALSRGDREPAVGSAVSGDAPHIAAYLRSEFERSLDEEDQTFLIRSAVLERITPPTAEAVTGMPRAGERLHRLAHDNLLIQAIGPDEHYRYHNLLRDFLQAELERREPGSSGGLHRRAAAWYAEAGRVDLAIEHALAGGDLDATADPISRAALATHYQGQTATVQRWLRAFDDAAIERHPPLAVIAAWIHLMTGQPELAERMADIADRSEFDGPTPDGAASFESGRAMLRAIMVRHGPRDALENAQLAVAAEGPDSPWRPIALMCLGWALSMNGDLVAADTAFAASAAAAPRSGAWATGMHSLAKRASFRIRTGDWSAAEESIGEARGLLDEWAYHSIITSLLVYAIGARIAIHRGDLTQGRQDLVRAQLLGPLVSHAAPAFCVDAELEFARAHLANSDAAGAQQAVREAERIVRRRPGLGTLARELVDLRRQVEGANSALAGSSTLTTAELRVLPLLPTYLSFQEIADRLTISRNTVKTHAMSIYGKLWASSRGEAVERAVELGLLEPYPALAPIRRMRVDDASDGG